MRNQVCGLLLAAVCGASPGASATLFEGARLITDARRPPIENSAFLMDGGRIVKVGKKGELKAPPGTMRVDLTAKTVIPALVDSHIHIGYQKGLSYSAESYTRENLIDQLNRYAYCGVAAVLSLGTDPGDMPLEIRADQRAGRLGGAWFLLAGRGLAAPNAGPNNPALKPSAYGVTTEEEARRDVREQIAHQVAFIKIWVDDRNGTVQKLSPVLYRAAIDEAHKHGTRAIAHVYYLDDAKDLVRAGIDGFAHLVRDKEVDDEFIALLKQHGVYVMPNLGLAENATHAEPPAWLDDPLYRAVTPAAVVDRLRASYAKRSPEALARARKTYAIMQHNLAKLNAAGVRIGFGADSGAAPDYFHGYNDHRELQLMVAAGMTPAQALTAATVTSAAFLRLTDRGAIAPGKSADFIILDANPLDNIANTEKISKVYLRGQEINRIVFP
ncbi:MAG TPA: amidohydrolase family protein [Bryobacteraceae bacterium]|nr:amidohydrolase family protein [Bryobacteraceae bacterium]